MNLGNQVDFSHFFEHVIIVDVRPGFVSNDCGSSFIFLCPITDPFKVWSYFVLTLTERESQRGLLRDRENSRSHHDVRKISD